MSSHHIRRRPDANQAAIIEELRKRGVFVQDISGAGDGLPDIFTYSVRDNATVFIELKAGRYPTIKASQIGWLSRYLGDCGIARNAQEAYDLATSPALYALKLNQKDKLAAYHKTMTANEVSLSVILRLIQE
jgi:hypothetical protein